MKQKNEIQNGKKYGSAPQAEMESKELNQLQATKKQLDLKLKTFVVIGEEDITGVRGWLVQMNSARNFVVSKNSNSISYPLQVA